MEQVKLWPANSLPVPPGASIGILQEGPSEVEIDMNDNFSKGKVCRYFQHQGYGFIKDRAEREVYFNLAEMEFVGSKSGDCLKEDITVGYDLSQSGRGLHVKKMKIY